MTADLHVLRRCDGILALDLDEGLGAWRESTGAAQEWAEAGRLGLWRFERLDDVPDRLARQTA